MGLNAAAATAAGTEVDEYMVSLRGNDRAILEGEDGDCGFVKVVCRKGTDEILGATVCANRAVTRLWIPTADPGGAVCANRAVTRLWIPTADPGGGCLCEPSGGLDLKVKGELPVYS